MTATVESILATLEELYPPRFAMEGDPNGLFVGDREKPVSRCAVSLDAEPAEVAAALDADCSLLISHHPMIFHPVERFTGHTITDRAVEAALRGDLSVISTHTSCDFAPGGLCDELAFRLEIVDAAPLTEQDGVSLARRGRFKQAVTQESLLQDLDKLFGGELRWCGGCRGDISTVALCSGSGADLLESAISADVDLFITGDVKYHAAREAQEWSCRRPNGFLFVDGGHYGTEHFFVQMVIEALRPRHSSVEFVPIDAGPVFNRR